jgi:peptide/nickel transport system permease protein
MTNYIIRRLIAVPFMLLGMSFILFVLLWLRPGSAAFASVASIGDFQGELDIFEERLGLDRPWYVQYLD